jgi:hypothetical protein
VTTSPNIHDPPLGLGLTSVVLGVVGLILFFLPILSIPLGGVGLVFGVAGFVLALMGGWSSLRWSVTGIVLSGLALAISLAIAQAPAGYLPSRAIPLDTQPVPDRPYVSPPARPGAMFNAGAPTTMTDEIDVVSYRSKT